MSQKRPPLIETGTKDWIVYRFGWAIRTSQKQKLLCREKQKALRQVEGILQEVAVPL